MLGLRSLNQKNRSQPGNFTKKMMLWKMYLLPFLQVAKFRISMLNFGGVSGSHPAHRAERATHFQLQMSVAHGCNCPTLQGTTYPN